MYNLLTSEVFVKFKNNDVTLKYSTNTSYLKE